ncbi:hypothetical protein AURDEDRAFT_168309 [Auricularia subglabra TFB-10046 SS5]|nr:hypothetical protein AURDEDRAFT_168309 [Auricularia subglabra TFB-10046 SS5]
MACSLPTIVVPGVPAKDGDDLSGDVNALTYGYRLYNTITGSLETNAGIADSEEPASSDFVEWMSSRPTEQSGFDLTKELVDIELFHHGSLTTAKTATWQTNGRKIKVFVKYLRMQKMREIRSVIRIFGETMQFNHPNIELYPL